MQNNEISFADKKYISGREYVGVNRIEGSLVVVKKTHPVALPVWICRTPKSDSWESL